MLFIILINLFSFICFGIDKWRAIRHKFRISEKNLLFLLVVGPFGGVSGMVFFRHKIKKWHFKTTAVIAVTIQIYLSAVM